MRTVRSAVLPVLFLAALCLATGPLPGQEKPASEIIPLESMAGLDFSGLTEQQKELFGAIMNESACDCGCGMTLARCRRDDSTCGKSLSLGKRIINDIKQGKTRAAIFKSTLAPPSKFVEFALEAGSAPFVGPADAKVTILHYLDYQ